MAAFPTYARLIFSGAGVGFDPSVEVAEMERGPAKMRIGNTHVVKKLRATAVFFSNDDAIAFETWYFDEIKRIGYFDLRDPFTGTTVSARFENGAIGDLQPITGGFGVASRELTFEFMR